jgi:hypothetical protein
LALLDFAARKWNLVVLSIIGKEVSLDKAVNIEVGELPRHVNHREPRFYFHVWSHAQHQFTLFIYCCPPSAPVKTRMVYPTAKAAIAKDAEAFGISIDRKLEISEADSVTDDALFEDLIEAPVTQTALSQSATDQEEHTQRRLTGSNSAPPDLLAKIAKIGRRL